MIFLLFQKIPRASFFKVKENNERRYDRLRSRAGIEIIKTVVWILAFVLTLCVVLTGVILCGQLRDFMQHEKTTVMQLNPKKAAENLSAPAPAAPNNNTQTATGNNFKPGFEARDNLVVWSENTEVEIFHITYNETGNITVDGADDSVIAPGTSNIYDFSFKNTGNVDVKYTLTAEAKFSDTELSVPVSVRLNGSSGKYLVGSASSFDKAEKLNSISDSQILTPKSYANYALEWQWPFEGEWGDEFDTKLGNRAADEDITMTVVLKVNAEADMSDSPYTGDRGITLYLNIAIGAFVAIVLLILILKKLEKKGNAND